MAEFCPRHRDADRYVCQGCGLDLCSFEHPSKRSDVLRGNVCPECFLAMENTLRVRSVPMSEVAACPHHRLDPGHYIPRHKTEEDRRRSPA